MKTTMKIVLGAAVVLVIVGLVGGCFFNNRGIMDNDNSFGRGMMGGSNGFDMPNGDFDMNGASMRGSDISASNTGVKIGLEELEQRVNSYIAQYDEELTISDIFVFEDSDYYFSIMEEDTGMGAMELLVNPYTGDIYPEFGPNMMWNLKYGMHGRGGYGMMGRGMMDRDNDSFSSDNTERNTISSEDAQSKAAQYIADRADDTYSVSSEGHEFYGYYTFHLEQNGETVGMMSVNGFTGDVWYHDWHGTVEQVIDGHTDDH